jgi:hypothetical protein
MGDRTYATLWIKTVHADAVKPFADKEGYADKGTYEDSTYFGFEEVNNGELSFLEELEKLGIAYNSSWAPGGEYGAGTRSARFTPEGAIDIREIYDAEYNPPLSELKQRINSPEELKAYILLHEEKVTPLPWDNQEQYGKLYRAACLIKPPQE